MKFLPVSATLALGALAVLALPAKAFPPVWMSGGVQVAHQPIHYRSLRPWHKAMKDRYCKRRARHICKHAYRPQPDESRIRSLQRTYCTSDLYEECVLSRQIGSLGSHYRH